MCISPRGLNGDGCFATVGTTTLHHLASDMIQKINDLASGEGGKGGKGGKGGEGGEVSRSIKPVRA